MNRDIVRYLEEGRKRGFSVQLLKGKLLEGGFLEKDVDEAIATMNPVKAVPEGKIDLFDKSQDDKYPKTGDVGSKQTPPAQKLDQFKGMTGIQQKPEVKPDEPKKEIIGNGNGGSWIKIGAILGIVLLLFGIAGIVLSFVAGDFLDSLMSNDLTMMIIGIVLVLMSSIYYYGFVKIGKKTGQKTLSMGSWFIIIPIIIYLVLVIGASFFVYEQAMNFYSGVDSEGAYKVTFLVLAILWVIALLLNVIGMILSAVGMIKSGGEIKILKVAGIVNIFVFIAGLGFLAGTVMFIYATLNDFSLGSTGLGQDEIMGNAVVAIWSLTILFGLRQIARIFETIGLFSASRKFE